MPPHDLGGCLRRSGQSGRSSENCELQVSQSRFHGLNQSNPPESDCTPRGSSRLVRPRERTLSVLFRKSRLQRTIDEVATAVRIAIACPLPLNRIEPFVAGIDIIIRGSLPVYSRADLTRTMVIVVALFFTAISTSAPARQFRADTVKQTRPSAINLDCSKLE